MTDFVLTETIVLEIMRRLTSDLPAHITAVNATITDGYTIENPASGMIFDYPPPIRLLTNFPAVALIEGATTFEDDTSWNATGVSDFTVVAFVQDLEQEGLARRLRRYARAVASAVIQGRTLPPDGWGVTLIRIEPGPTLANRNNPQTRMSWVSVSFRVKTDQNVG